MEKPINFTEKRIRHLLLARKNVVTDALEKYGKVPMQKMADIMEIDMEVQRLQLGFKPHRLVEVLPKDIYWRRQTNYDQTRTEQANEQSDTKL